MDAASASSLAQVPKFSRYRSVRNTRQGHVQQFNPQQSGPNSSPRRSPSRYRRNGQTSDAPPNSFPLVKQGSLTSALSNNQLIRNPEIDISETSTASQEALLPKEDSFNVPAKLVSRSMSVEVSRKHSPDADQNPHSLSSARYGERTLTIRPHVPATVRLQQDEKIDKEPTSHLMEGTNKSQDTLLELSAVPYSDVQPSKSTECEKTFPSQSSSRPFPTRPVHLANSTSQKPQNKITARTIRREDVPRKPSSGKPLARDGPAPLSEFRSKGYSDATFELSKGAVLGFDAPKSAANAADRIVIVKYGSQSVQVPVTPQTTAGDVLNLAREHLQIDKKSSQHILNESFQQLMIERPLRYYERMRDVMSSWDSDDQNEIFLSIPLAFIASEQFYARGALSKPPDDQVFSIYHSQKPGNWDKRVFTLRTDGQILVTKTTGDCGKNICHMSDSDIYLPTARYVKKLKAPRKHCFAIKSQQKSAMFMDKSNFVHFFSMKDRHVARSFHDAVYTWRSWYLSQEMGLRDDTRKSIAASHRSTASDSNDREGSVSGQEFVLGARDKRNFHQPNYEHTAAGQSYKAPCGLVSPPSQSRKLFTKNSSAKASSFYYRPSLNEQTFAPSSLLGDSYSARLNAISTPPAEPNDPAAIALSSSRVKPLVNLTAQEGDLVHQSRWKPSYKFEHVPSGGLVAAATTTLLNQQLAANNPSVWHRPTELRQGKVDGPPKHETMQDSGPFTGGLLARASDGAGGCREGRGVACGNRGSKEPMLDLHQDSAYVPGSLLDSVERYRQQENKGPIFDRGRSKEITLRIGEDT